MKFSQVNLNRSHTAANDLTAFLADHHGQSELISLIQEPYCYRNKVCCLNKKNMDLLYKQGSGRPRAAIYSTLGAGLTVIPELTTVDCVTALWPQHKDRDVVVCSAYLDIEKAVLTPELKNVVTYCEDNRLGLILGMDSNAHSTLWGNEDNNPRGDALEEYVMENILDCHNIPDQPTFIGRGCSTTIDLTLSNRHFTGEILNWTTNDEAVTTDHTLITFDCEAHNRIKAPKNYIFSCLLYTSPSPRDGATSRMPSSA